MDPRVTGTADGGHYRGLSDVPALTSPQSLVNILRSSGADVLDPELAPWMLAQIGVTNGLGVAANLGRLLGDEIDPRLPEKRSTFHTCSESAIAASICSPVHHDCGLSEE